MEFKQILIRLPYWEPLGVTARVPPLMPLETGGVWLLFIEIEELFNLEDPYLEDPKSSLSLHVVLDLLSQTSHCTVFIIFVTILNCYQYQLQML